MSLVDYGKKELELAGLFDKESDYEGMIGDAVLDLLKTFSKQGHSGFSAILTLEVFTKLAKFQPLTEITDNPKDWMYIAEDQGGPVYQSTRQPGLFSNDGGKTYYDIEGDRDLIKQSKPNDQISS